MWTCIKCGEKHEDTFDDCWNCGTSRDGTENPAFRCADDVGSAEAGRLPLVLDPAADVAALPTDGDTGILRKMALSTTRSSPDAGWSGRWASCAARRSSRRKSWTA